MKGWVKINEMFVTYIIFIDSAILTDELSQFKNISEISLFESLLQGLTSSKVWSKFVLLISVLFLYASI